MSRYIDAEALKEKYTMVTKRYSGGIMERPAVLLETIDDAPSIDIVRCKECRHWRTREDETRCCVREYATECWRADDYCSYGERKE